MKCVGEILVKTCYTLEGDNLEVIFAYDLLMDIKTTLEQGHDYFEDISAFLKTCKGNSFVLLTDENLLLICQLLKEIAS